MKLTTRTTTVLLVMAALCTLAFDQHDDNIQLALTASRIFAPGEAITLDLSVYSQRPVEIDFTAYRVLDPPTFFLDQENPHTLEVRYYNYSQQNISVDLSDHSKYRKVTAWRDTVQPQSQYYLSKSIQSPTTDAGVYVVSAGVGENKAIAVVVVTGYATIVKQSRDEVLAYVCDRASGERVRGARVIFGYGRDRRVRTSTGSDGVARRDIADLFSGDRDSVVRQGSLPLIVVGERDGNFFISDSYFNRYYGNVAGSHLVYLHTDRPVYRPSQTVLYRGIVRKMVEMGEYELPSIDSVSVEIRDPRGNSLKRDRLAVSDLATFHGELTLGEEPPLGSYSVMVTTGVGQQNFGFAVEEYKKPEYEVKITTDRQQYTRGDEIKATIRADYYFGSPVSEGEVSYSIFRGRYWRPWWRNSEWAYLYEGMPQYAPTGTEMIHNGSGKLASDGTFTFSYPTPKQDEDYVYTIQANVVDASRRSIAGVTTVTVTRSDIYVTSRTDRYVYKPGERVTVNVTTFAFDGDRGKSAEFDVRVKRVWWEGRSYNQREEKIWSGSGMTDRNGSGSIGFTASEPGYFTIEAIARDSHGTEVTTSTSAYIADRHYSNWYNSSSNSVQIIPDRDLYKPGEMMSALVIMPVADLDALITAEGPSLYRHSVQRISGNAAVIRVPIEERNAPNFYLNVSAISADRMYTASRSIMVAPEHALIQLEVRPDKQQYKPGDKGSVTVRALDADGEPVRNVDVALAVVDEALYAIRPDQTPDMQRFFYPIRWNQVGTQSSLNFYLQNQWLVSHTLLNSGISLSGGVNGFSIRGGRSNETNIQVDGISLSDPFAGGFGNTAGDLSAQTFIQPTIRLSFKDQMFWTPSVRTDQDGRATVEITFPDNLTTWRITAHGITRATAVGQARASVVARKDLLIRMETPRFITKGDSLLIATTVHNYLGTAKLVKVELQAEGLSLKEREQMVTIPANGQLRIDWPVTAPEAGPAKLTAKALTDEESDAMQLEVPVLPLGVHVANSTIAEIGGSDESRTLRLTLPAESDFSTASLTLSLSPSTVSSILGSLDQLVSYPYGCVEQTMSRFLPLVVVASALEKLHLPFDPGLRSQIPKMVAAGVNRLYQLQHQDGGWGWWGNDGSNPFTTAYVMYGMSIARSAGYDVIDDRYTRSAARLRQHIESIGKSGNDRVDLVSQAYMLSVASFIARGNPDKLLCERIEWLAEQSNLNTYGTALLALAAHYQGEKEIAAQLAARLRQSVSSTGSQASWTGGDWNHRWQEDNVETSAAAVKALLAIEGESDLIGKGVRWLLTKKQGNAWYNTRQTAMVIFALVDYLAVSHELNPDYEITVKVNGNPVFSRKMGHEDLFLKEQEVSVGSELLRRGENVISIEKRGVGKLYASARLSYNATGNAIESAQAGFRVEREYHLLRRVLDGSTYVYQKTKFNGTVRSGDEILVKVRMIPEKRGDYIMLEDPLPAGCEVITKTDNYVIEEESDYTGPAGSGRGYYNPRGQYWRWWYADRDVRDEKVSFFTPSVQAQPCEFSYIMRAQIPGKYSVMPSVACLMYYPEVRGNSGAIAMTITE